MTLSLVSFCSCDAPAKKWVHFTKLAHTSGLARHKQTRGKNHDTYTQRDHFENAALKCKQNIGAEAKNVMYKLLIVCNNNDNDCGEHFGRENNNNNYETEANGDGGAKKRRIVCVCFGSKNIIYWNIAQLEKSSKCESVLYADTFG